MYIQGGVSNLNAAFWYPASLPILPGEAASLPFGGTPASNEAAPPTQLPAPAGESVSPRDSNARLDIWIDDNTPVNSLALASSPASLAASGLSRESFIGFPMQTQAVPLTGTTDRDAAEPSPPVSTTGTIADEQGENGGSPTSLMAPTGKTASGSGDLASDSSASSDEAAAADEANLAGNSADTQKATGKKANNNGETELTEEEQKTIRQLQDRDREVRAHEQAHVGAGGAYVLGGPTYEYQVGPDKKQYAIGGEVQIDTSPVPGDARATVAKARIVRAAALAPASPSSQDMAVAAAATQIEMQAQADLVAEQAQTLFAGQNQTAGASTTNDMPAAKSAAATDGQTSGPAAEAGPSGRSLPPLPTAATGTQPAPELPPPVSRGGIVSASLSGSLNFIEPAFEVGVGGFVGVATLASSTNPGTAPLANDPAPTLSEGGRGAVSSLASSENGEATGSFRSLVANTYRTPATAGTMNVVF